MADSDDEYDRRGSGRDKFRRERNDFGGGGGRGGAGAGTDRPPVSSGATGASRRDDWPDRNDSASGNLVAGSGGNSSGGGGLSSSMGSLTGGGGGGWSSSSSLNRDRLGQSGGRDYGRDRYGMSRSYGGSRNDRYSPADRSGDMSPPQKRMRSRDWDDRYPNYELGGGHHGGHYGGGGGGGHHDRRDYGNNWSSGGHDRSGGERGGGGNPDDEQYQPPMQTLKQFLHDQDDHIDEETLMQKYQVYKADFRKTQIQEFFNRHKDEEWFRCKYFPDEIEKRKERQAAANQRRLEVFMELFGAQYFDSVALDVDQADAIVRVRDAIVIKLEGGSDFDLKSLDELASEESLLPKTPKSGGSSIFAVDSAGTSKASGVVVAPKSLDLSVVEAEKKPKEEGEEGEEESQKAMDSGLEDESGEIKEDPKSPKPETEQETPMEAEVSTPAEPPVPKELNDQSNDGELIEEGEDPSDDKPSRDNEPGSVADEPPKPRPLHKTCSIFFRNLAPSITRLEIEDECKKFPGFLRLALSEPQMDRRFNRRGWATFERTVNIREICWALNSVKIRGTEIGPIVNRDLTRRIRSVNGVSSHKLVVRADIRHAAKLIMKLDEEKGLWKESEEAAGTNGNGSGPIMVPSRNPLLKNITDYLIEEASAEEEELLGGAVDEMNGISDTTNKEAGEENGTTNGTGDKAQEGSTLERDEELIAVLDKLLFYLRIVHSTDYYNHSEYPSEDEMPNRIGLIHARGLLSSARVPQSEIQDYIKETDTKVAPLLAPAPIVTPEEARKLGARDLDESVEAFIKENTKELGEGKWLCPLSNKKFMGPEFVRKHILNKHMERVDQVKQESVYFNNYVADPRRPQLPEHPRSGGGSGGSSGNYRDGTSRYSGGDMHGGVYGSGGGYRTGAYGPGGRYQLHTADYNRGFRRSRYRDLDAPNDD